MEPPSPIESSSSDIFTNWKDGQHVLKHEGFAFQHEMGARGQPPLAFYLRVMGHAAAALPRPHARAVVVTAPDQANPVVPALKLLGAWPLLDRPALPLALSSSRSFAADLSLLLCAQSLVLASSSLSGEGGLLRDSPHLREVYRFEPSEEGCLPATPPRPCATSLAGGGRRVREWCVHANGSRGGYGEHEYSPARKWLNSAPQQLEMLQYREVSAPRLVCSP